MQMDDANITKDKIESIVALQNKSYESMLENIMSNKKVLLRDNIDYEAKIFALSKIVKINRRAGYDLAVIRDEVKINSYKILTRQHEMIKSILRLLDKTTGDEFIESVNKYTQQNKISNAELVSSEYKTLLEKVSSSNTLLQVQENIKEFNTLLEINDDIISHITKYESKLYSLNKYANYHVLDLVLFVQKLQAVKLVDSFLTLYGFSVIKFIFITFSIALIYMLRKLLYTSVEFYLQTSESKKYITDILMSIRKMIHIFIIIINLNIIFYIYHDFSSTELSTRIFNILYAITLTIIFYKVINTIAKIKISDIGVSEKQIKNEIINIGIKIVNFLIMLFGLLIVLYIGGVDLTAVLSGLGIGGFAVALAAKDSLANFFGTLSILISDVFSQGDWIVIDGKQGVVVEIGLRVTTLRTFDNALIAIPNATLANNDVKNWNKRILGRRIKMSLGIKYDSKSQDIRNAVKEIHDMLDQHPDIATENTKHSYGKVKGAKLVSKDDLKGVKKTLLVYLDEFTDSSINILVYCFTKSTAWEDWLTTKEDVMHKIMEIFEKNNLEFAFPSMSIYKEN